MMEKEIRTPFEIFGVEVEKGWRPLVEPILRRIGELNAGGAGIEVTQVKEKYGALRFYTGPAPAEIQEMIAAAEEKSVTVCERCGAPAERIVSTSHWIYTLCPDCLKEKGITVWKKESEVEEY